MPKKFSTSADARRRRKGALERLIRQRNAIMQMRDLNPQDSRIEDRLERIDKEIHILEGRI